MREKNSPRQIEITLLQVLLLFTESRAFGVSGVQIESLVFLRSSKKQLLHRVNFRFGSFSLHSIVFLFFFLFILFSFMAPKKKGVLAVGLFAADTQLNTTEGQIGLFRGNHSINRSTVEPFFARVLILQLHFTLFHCRRRFSISW